MKRHAFALQVKEGNMNDFRKLLGEMWKDITAFLDKNEIHNFSLWNCDDLVFGYAETADETVVCEGCLGVLVEKVTPLVEWISAPGAGMRLMYHDFGIVRENKELIRHRMFMTKLKPGCDEEYKRRHDGLIEARGGVPDPGPDSNFSIWSAGGYIFGYDEIDTTMETAETEEAKAATIAWETRQLEIMDWITNDVDWLTGQHHSSSVRLAWHR